MRRARWLVTVLALPLAAGAATGVTLSASPLLSIQVGPRSTRAEVSVNDISGDELMLEWKGGHLSGRWMSQSVDLALGRASIKGNVGATQTSVKVKRTVLDDADGLALDGDLGDDQVSLWVTPTWIRGLVGPCTYSLGLSGTAYRGWRDCGSGGVPVPFALELPDMRTHNDDASVAALLLTVLAPVEPTPAFNPRVSVEDRVDQLFGLRLRDAQAEQGAQVVMALPGTPAARAGLREGMVVTRAGLAPVTSGHELAAALARLRPGESLVLRLHAPGKLEWTVLAITAPPQAVPRS
jgi:hypothetical protein